MPTPRAVPSRSAARCAALCVALVLAGARAAGQGLGTHDQFEAQGVTLLGWVPPASFLGSEGADDCWGYTSPSGREYALLGATDAIGFVEVTNPTEPVVVAAIAAPSSNFHDVKTYSGHAYSVSEAGGGIQVFDLSQIDAGVVTELPSVTAGGSTATHNVVVDTTSGFLYRCDGGGFVGGLRMYDLAVPAAPAYLGDWTVRDVHDAQVVTYDSGPFAGRQIGFLASTGTGFEGLTIVDLTDKQNVVVLGDVEYPNQAVSHQGWLSADKAIFYFGDEADELSFLFTTRTHMFGVAELTNPTYLGWFTNGVFASDHNLYVRGSTIYEANFMSGLRVFDASSPTAPVEIAWFDTQPSVDTFKTEGLWSNYPFLPSGTILGSDEVKGLFVWRLGPPALAFSFPGGLPDPVPPEGATLLVHVDEASPGALLPGSPTLHVRTGDGMELDAPLVDLGGGDFQATLPGAACGDVLAYRFSARSTDGLLWRSPASTEDDYHQALVAAAETVLVEFDMEADEAWTSGAPGDTASAGFWQRDRPNGTAAQSEIDRTPGAGTDCWFTGQGTEGLDNGVADVDNGTTTLLSPIVNVSGAADPWIDYWRWYHNAGAANPGTDVFEVEVTGDGTTWLGVETVGPTGDETRGGWRRHAFRVRDLLPAGNLVRLRFRASDGSGLPSVVEAAVDDLRVLDLACADCNGNGVDDGVDVSTGASPDLDGNGAPDECDPLRVDVAAISLAAGGTQTLTLDAGVGNAFGLYYLLTGASGTSPGLPLPPSALTLPLNLDGLVLFTALNPNLLVASSLDFLDAAGGKAAGLTLPAGLDPTLAGATLHHAYMLLETAGLTATFVSNAVPLALQP